MKFTITINTEETEYEDIEIEAYDCNIALNKVINKLANSDNVNPEDITSFVITGVVDR